MENYSDGNLYQTSGFKKVINRQSDNIFSKTNLNRNRKKGTVLWEISVIKMKRKTYFLVWSNHTHH